MPSKRHQRKPIAFLDASEITAVLAAPDLSTWIGLCFFLEPPAKIRPPRVVGIDVLASGCPASPSGQVR